MQDTDTTVKGFHQLMRVAGMAYGAVNVLQWGQPEVSSDFYAVKGCRGAAGAAPARV